MLKRVEGPKSDLKPTPASRARLRVETLRGRLVFLVLSLLLPALAAAAFLVWDSSRHAYRLQERQLVATARTLSLVVDRQLSEQSGLLNALASSALLEAGDFRAFDAQARRTLADSRSWVVVRTPHGQQVVNTFLPPGAPLPRVANPRVAPNRPPRPDGVRVSDLATGAISRDPVVIVVKAVTLADGREVDLSIATQAKSYSPLLGRMPSSWTATIIDGGHRVIARSRDDDRFRGQTITPVLARRLQPGASGVMWGRSLDGIETRTAFEPVARSNWTVIIGVPRSELAAPAQRALIGGALVALVLLLAGVANAAHAARLIARSVDQLRRATTADFNEPYVALAPSGVREIDELATAFAASRRRIREHDAQQQLLINELNHRVKNTLATLQSVASHSRRSAGSVDQFHAAIEGRIMAMSGAHELLTRAAWSNADLGELARSALRPFEGARMVIEGPTVEVEPTDALNLTLIFYELATNASKYGALSGASGVARLTWTRREHGVEIRWTEEGGPEVRAPKRQGFGSRLLQKARERLSPSEIAFDRAGLRCTLTLRTAPPGPGEL